MSEIPPKNQMVALYARVSTEEQREGQTIESQVAELERFATGSGWRVANIYKDEGWSGSILARPELDRLRDDASKGLFNAVLFNDVDRLARDVTHLGIIKRDLEKRGVRVIFRKLPAENSPTYNLMVNILGSFAEFERALITDRTRRGRRHKVEVRKQYVGCVAPYGFHYTTKKDAGGQAGVLAIDPEEALIVRYIYQWAASGISLRKISARLLALGVPTRSGKHRWSSTTLFNILRGEVYKGTWAYGKKELCEPRKRRTLRDYYRQTKTSRLKRPKAQWLQISLPERFRIIDDSLWSEAQRRLTLNRRFAPRNAQHFYLLQGHLRCAYCNSACSGTFARRQYGCYFFYRCWRRCQQAKQIEKELLDTTVWSALRNALLEPKHFVKRLTAACDEAANDQPERATTLDNDLANQENILFQRYRLGELAASDLAHELEILRTQSQTKSKEADAEQLKSGNENTDLPDSLEAACRQIADDLNNADGDLRQDILRSLAVEAFVEADQVRIRATVAPEANFSANQGYAPGIVSPPPRRSERNCTVDFELTASLPGGGRRRT
jgi:site-specific DNA recombinase